MAQRKVSYPFLTQTELSLALVQLFKVTPGRITLQLTITFCNFSPSDVGYDLKLRKLVDTTANRHFLRGSATSGEGKLAAGNTEIWHITIRAADTYIFEAAADTANAIGVTFTAAEAQMTNE